MRELKAEIRRLSYSSDLVESKLRREVITSQEEAVRIYYEMRRVLDEMFLAPAQEAEPSKSAGNAVAAERPQKEE